MSGPRLYGEGDQPVTVSGQRTSPFPRVDTATDQRTANTLRRVDEWLLGNARDEIGRRGLLDTLPGRARDMTPADRDAANLILFDTLH